MVVVNVAMVVSGIADIAEEKEAALDEEVRTSIVVHNEARIVL